MKKLKDFLCREITGEYILVRQEILQKNLME